MKPIKPLKPLKPADEGPVRAASLLEDRRRSQRVMVRMPVVLHVTGRQKEIKCVTVAVSETGAMLMVYEPLPMGTQLIVENPSSQKKVGANVSRSPQVTAEGALVPVEFMEPAPNFWNIFFPPPGN